MSQRKIKIRLGKKVKKPRTRPMTANDIMLMMKANRKMEEARKKLEEAKQQAERIEAQLEKGEEENG